MSDSVRPHRRQPTRLPRPWVSPGKNTGVGCHFLLQCMKMESESEVTQPCPTLHDPVDCSLPGSSIRGIFQARVLKWGAIAFSLSVATSTKSLQAVKGWDWDTWELEIRAGVFPCMDLGRESWGLSSSISQGGRKGKGQVRNKGS